MKDFDRGEEYALKVDEPKVWRASCASRTSKMAKGVNGQIKA